MKHGVAFHLRHWINLRLLFVALLGILAGPRLFAAVGETWEVAGVTYTDVHVKEVTPATVMIRHSSGLAQLDLATMDEHFQIRFEYSEEKAAQWKRDAAANLAFTTDSRRRLESKRASEGRKIALARTTPGSADLPASIPLHVSVDLRPIYQQQGLYLRNQGRRPSCSVFAIISALEYEVARRRGTSEPLSEEFLIWAARRLQPGIPLDDGFHFEEVLSALQSFGVPRQTTMRNTFGRSMDEIEPSPEALSEAPMLHSVVPVWIRARDPLLVQRIILRLNDATPVVVGLNWPNWRTLEHTALLSEQHPLDGAGHAVTLVGYKCPDGNPENLVFIFRNSYGIRWGDGGCGYVTTAYLQKNLITAFTLTLPEDRAPVASSQ